ncbi:MAG TPA: hypothetical protein VFH80_13610, partial [Solirubrobacteraceae bacterium]|nr:hypothetical protein [Solirubrobacteraceae bacterium]
MPIPPKTPSRVFRTAPAKAAVAVGGAAVAACALLAFPATASAASGPENLIIRPPRPSLSFPVLPSTQFPTSFPTAGDSTIVPVGEKKSSAPQHSEQPQFSYVSTFSPQPVAPSAPANTASASCIANGQSVSGPGGDLDLPGINGTSQDPGHAGALPIKTLGPAGMLPPQIDSTNLGQLKVTRPVDATSANLSMVASSGYRFPCVHIEIGPGRGFANAEYALVNAGLVADDRSGSVETLTWTYSTILWSYTLPGSTTLHQGSGEINARPDRTTNSLVTDSKAVAAGTIGLTLVVSLGLLALYIVGRRRNKARYRARYYRRAAMRERRDGMAAAPVSAMQVTEPVEPAGIWEPQPGEAVGLVEAGGVAEAGEVVEAAEAPEALHEPQPELERETEQEAKVEAEVEQKSEAERESEAEHESEVEQESEAVTTPEAAAAPEAAEDSELAEEPESALEPEAEPVLEPEQESDQEPAAEPELAQEPE